MKPDYVPINCEFHDVLEARAVQRRIVALHYLDEDGQTRLTHSRIVDVYAQSSMEFIRLEQGAPIRLDRIIGIDGVRLSDFSKANG